MLPGQGREYHRPPSRQGYEPKLAGPGRSCDYFPPAPLRQRRRFRLNQLRDVVASSSRVDSTDKSGYGLPRRQGRLPDSNFVTAFCTLMINVVHVGVGFV
jgi:hypothetical protein